jgi:hypothetical protein
MQLAGRRTWMSQVFRPLQRNARTGLDLPIDDI